MFRRSKKGKDEKKDKKDKKGGSSPTSSPSSSASPPASSSSASPHPTAIAAYTSPTGEEFDDKRVSLPRRVKPGAKTALPDPSPASPPAGGGGANTAAAEKKPAAADSGLQDLDDLIATIDQRLGSSPPASAPQSAHQSAAAPLPAIDALSLADSDDPLAALMSFAGGVPSPSSPAAAAAPVSRQSVAPASSSSSAPAPRLSSFAPAAAASPAASSQAQFGSGRVSTSSVNEAMLDDILKQFGSPAPAAAAPQRASISSAAPPQRHSEAQEDDPLAALLAMGGVNVDFGSPAGGIQPQRGTIVSVGGGYNAPPPATAPSFPQMSGFPQQPMQATYSGGAGPAIATGPGGYWGNTTVTADVLEQHFPDPDDVDNFSTESVYIDSATQRYTLPQNKLELELRHEMMNLRRNPRFYAQILINEFRPFYQGTALRVPGQPGMATREGAVACDDAIRFLSSVAPMQDPIFLNFGMCLAAKEAVDECCPTGSFEYPDSVTKMMNYGYLEDEAKDLVGYGGKNVRHMILLAFIICDGDPSRERRRIIFDPRWRMMGVGAGEHNSPFKIMGVVNFAIAYTPLLDGMKNSPMFRNLVQVDLKEDAREMLDAIRSLQAGPVAAQPEEDDWRARLRAAALKVSQATGGMMLTDKREDSFIKAVDVFKQLKAVEGPGDDDTQAKLRQAALLVGKATEHLVVSNANDQQYIRPVDIFKDLQAVSNAPVEFDPLRAKLSNAALGAARSTEQLARRRGPYFICIK